MLGIRTSSLLSIGAVVAVFIAIAISIQSFTIPRRLIRNSMLPDIPDALTPAYDSCSDAELVSAVSLVVTVKDTCAQAEYILEKLAKMYPKDINVIYAYPAIRGCRHVPVGEIGRKYFSNWTEIAVGRSQAPIAGFLQAQKMLNTKYAVLMHNDAYPMEKDFICEMYRALEANPHYPIAAPQIYEAGDTGIIVPHGHHQNLHVRPNTMKNSDYEHRIDYDLSLDLLTARTAEDFVEGPQVDFLEDHAFFARTDKYHELLDEGGSFTMEYMDMILNMRVRNTSAWYVPTARCIFDVAISKMTWEDLPYFIYKRSEQIGHQVRTYLTNKWGVAFPNTGIWNYVRYVFLANLFLGKDQMPTEWEDNAAIFYSWFESAGYNRYDGRMFPDFIEEPSEFPVNITRIMQVELPTDVPAHRVPPQGAYDTLPKQNRKTPLMPEISFKNPHIAIALNTRSCTAGDPNSYEKCGMVVEDGMECTCWNYVPQFNLDTTLYLDKLMDFLKLPSRAFMFAQMKFFAKTVKKEEVDYFCEGSQVNCGLQVHFPRSAKVVQWSWFGKRQLFMFTSEGMSVASVLGSLILLPITVTYKLRKRTKKM